jgi:hypothetical protein
MDIIQYLDGSDERLRQLAVDARLQIVRLRRLVADPSQPVRYMTARRLCAATGGGITMEAMAARGPLRGSETFAGPRGQAVATAGSTGPDIPTRLAAYGIASDHFTEVLLRGRVPGRRRMAAYIEAFHPHVDEDLFHRHAQWRRGGGA